jgi:flagellar motility protein MotE (MotC chaperone)
VSDTLPQASALDQLLETRLLAWEQAHEPQKLKLLDCYGDKLRIPRDNDTKGTGAARAKTAVGIFVGSTRNKVRAARAKINDALFGNGKFPFDTNPVNEELRAFSDTVEEILTAQLERMNAKALLKSGVDTLATYGTGFMFGPFVRKECLVETSADNALGYTAIKEQKFEYDHPYFMLANTADVSPDPEARSLPDGLGLFWTTMESRHTVEAWKADKSYKNIDQALLSGGETGTDTGSDRQGQLRANVQYWHKGDRIRVARFFGKVPKRTLSEAAPIVGEVDSGEMVDAIIIMAGGVVVKANAAPYGGKSAAMACQYEDEPHEIWGVGVAENNAPHQKVVNAAFRLFMEGKGMALLGTKSVDRSAFLPGEDFKKYPGKVYQMKPNLSPEERQTAIIDHKEQDITGGWLDAIKVSEQFSDDDTGITKYTQGDDSSNLNKTATGISMIMSASSLPLKEVIQNIDENWIEPMIERLIDWNLKYLEVDTVEKLHGKKTAELWGRIKQFGKSSFMEWQATGTSSFMQKEVLTSKLRAFAEFAMSNPATAPLVDARELLEQTWDVMEIGKESPILKEEGNEQLPPQVQQQMQQTEQHAQEMEKALHDLGQQFNELHAKAEENAENRRIEAYKAHTERLKVIAQYMTPEMIAQVANEVGFDIGADAIAQQQETNAAAETGSETAEPQPEAMEPAAQPEPAPPAPAPEPMEPPA